MHTTFFNKHKILIHLILIFLSSFTTMICMASSGRGEGKDTIKLKDFDGVIWEYYGENPIHPELLIELNKQRTKAHDELNEVTSKSSGNEKMISSPSAPSGQKSEQSTSYGKDGHLYTTFLVARLAGFTEDRAHLLSYFSQLPDEEFEFTAIGGFLFAEDDEKKKLVMSTLHSLHGGDEIKIKKRQNDLYKLLNKYMNNKKPQDWQIGIILHAYADSFAHTYEENGKLKAYDLKWGHAMHMHRPDTIAFYPEKFKEYVNNLYTLFNVEKKPGTDLAPVFAFIDKLSTDQEESILQLNGLAIEYGYNQKKCEEIGKAKRKCIRRSKIKKLLRTMEKSFTVTE